MYSNSCGTFVMLLTLSWDSILLDLYDLVDNKIGKNFDLKGCSKHKVITAAYQAARLKKDVFYDVMISGHDKTASINFQVQSQCQIISISFSMNLFLRRKIL